MKSSILAAALFASVTLFSNAATINWSAGVDNGFSLANGADLPIGAIIKVGYFRDPGTGAQLSDSAIAAADLATLQAAFVEAGSSTVGTGFDPAIAEHFSVRSDVNTGSAGLNLVGKQIYVWVLNGSSVAASTQHAILYWSISDTTTNPDNGSTVPGYSWRFPADEPIPGVTTIDVSDLTAGATPLVAGARLVVGTFATGTSATTGGPNFGLAQIDAPLTIPTAASLAAGVVGASYSATVAAQGGRSPYGFAVTSGALPGGLTFNTANGEISGTPGAAGSSTFTITVTDGISTTQSKSFTIVVVDPLAISTAPTLPSATRGQTYTQVLGATGGTSPLGWNFLSGDLPAGLTLASDGEISGTPTGTGTFSFTVEVTDAGTLADTETFSLTVLAAPPAISNPSSLSSAVVNVPYSQTFLVPGAGPFTWSVSAGNVPSGMNFSAGVLSGTPSDPGSSAFSVQVVGPAGISTKAFTLEVLSVAVTPSVVAPVFPPASVSDGSFSYALQASPRPDSFTVLGLPPGLKADLKTGIISGRPTTPGVYVVRVKAKNAKGTSGEVGGQLIVQALPTGAIGTFVGHIARATVNGGLGGRIDLTTTAVGAYTLKLTQGLVTTTMKGFLKVVPGSDPTINDTTTTTPAITAALAFDSDNNSFAGDISVDGTLASAKGWRSTWNKLTAPASFHAGYYSIGMSLPEGSTTDVNIPQGHGFASFTVGLDGKLTVKGKTADGNVITCAGFMGSKGEILVFQQLYGKRGTLIGQVDMTLDPNKTFIENSVEGDVSWSKPDTVGSTYPGAFGPLDLDTSGKFLATSPKGSVVQGLPAVGIAKLMFDSSGLAFTSSTDPDVPAFTFNSFLKPVLPAAGAVGNLGKATLLMNVADGGFKGVFTLEDLPVKRTVPYEGIIVRSGSATIKGMGYFLAPQIGSTQKLGGTVTIEQNP